ncbi:predicted protein [Nematostella vectensis]|uniref:Progestin and adipoQ receptor family member 3 n=1 Tax=Nematostella vectensis TaxID=45351 RepID=A7SIY6_NEMVE|nr:predicted protein [Nematostella vectensis]|eukprot:XP_001628391.1 predicted protein [Nematostella vectensis]
MTFQQFDYEKQSPDEALFVLQQQGKDINLFDYHEIPYFLRGNVYVTNGYRAYLPVRMCIKSLFVWSNETINIWTHLLGFLVFSFLFLYNNIVVLPHIKGATIADHMVFSALLIGFQICLLCSTGYHLFNCHSEKIFHRWFSLDLAGISLGLCSCYIPAVYYAYYCHVGLQTLYLVGVGILTTITLTLQFHPRFLSSVWATRRLLLFCCLVAYGVVPSVHWAYLSGGWDQPVVQIFIPKVIVMYVLGVLALVFYALKVPERYFPGKMNFIGSSHQWWHVLILAAFYWWYRSNLIYLDYRSTNQCTDPRQISAVNVL